MLEIYIYTFASVILVSIASLIGIVALLLNERILGRAVFFMVSLAVGALLGGAFIHLIPEAFEEHGSGTLASLLVIAGILIFFSIEKFLHWHHRHGQEEEEYHPEYHKQVAPSNNSQPRIHPLGYMILISDGFHNLLDGIIIAVSFLASIELGIAATIAVLLHEIPQEIGDFGVLLHAGFSKMRALFFNFLSASAAILGAGIALLVSEVAEGFASVLLPVAAGGFIYIATVDLIPELHKTIRVGRSLAQFAVILIGVGAMLALVLLE